MKKIFLTILVLGTMALQACHLSPTAPPVKERPPHESSVPYGSFCVLFSCENVATGGVISQCDIIPGAGQWLENSDETIRAGTRLSCS